MLADDSKKIVDYRKKLHKEYIMLGIFGVIGLPCVLIGWLNWFGFADIKIEFIRTLIGEEVDVVFTPILIVIGVICTCAFLAVLSGMISLSRHIHRLKHSIKQQTLASEL